MTLPTPYFMCSEAECQERQSSGEISIFESHWPPPSSLQPSTPSSSSCLHRGIQKTKQTRRIVNPLFAMTKYRRSAAGVDTKNRTPPRSLPQLESCLDILEYILCHQQQPPSTSDTNKPFPKQALTGTVSFVEDRIRAIQVDMVVSQQPSAALQYRIVKCHILILYLLGSVATYEAQFGRQALSAALTNYWDDRQRGKGRDDEMLCFMALQRLCQYYQAGGTDESSLSFILGYYRSNIEHPQLSDYPHFQWALHLVQLAVMGRPQSLLRQLVELGSKGADGNQCSPSFTILCRCCLSPIVDILRFQTLEQYNKCYMKGEKVKTEELARLLYFGTAQQAGDFAETVAGLNRNRDGEDDKIVFKVGAVQQSDKMEETRQDEFVFGAYYGNWSTNGNKAERSAWDDSEPPKLAAENTITNAYTGAMTDVEGVLIPPATLLHSILQGDEL